MNPNIINFQFNSLLTIINSFKINFFILAVSNTQILQTIYINNKKKRWQRHTRSEGNSVVPFQVNLHQEVKAFYLLEAYSIHHKPCHLLWSRILNADQFCEIIFSSSPSCVDTFLPFSISSWFLRVRVRVFQLWFLPLTLSAATDLGFCFSMNHETTTLRVFKLILLWAWAYVWSNENLKIQWNWFWIFLYRPS